MKINLLVVLCLVSFVVTEYTLQFNNNVIDFRLNSYQSVRKIINNETHVQYYIDGYIRTDKVGDPNLPIIRRAFLGQNISFEILDFKLNSRTTSRIIPIRRYSNRCKFREYPWIFSDRYFIDEFFPKNIINSFQFYSEKNHKGFILEINPFLYNPVTNELLIIDNLRIRLNDVTFKPLYDTNKAILYRNLFMNYVENLREDKLTILIIAADSYVDVIAPLIKSKSEIYDVIFSKLSNISKTKDPIEIKSYIKNLFLNNSLSNVILIGNVNDIPSHPNDHTEHSDSNYGQMYDMPNVNVHISRISGDKISIIRQINKIIWYDKLSEIDLESYQGIASAQGQIDLPTDCQFMDILNKMIANEKKIKKTFYKQCGPNANKTNVIDHINRGLTFINYIGHGSGTSWVTTNFDVNDAKNLKNVYNNSIVIDVSCSNGDLTINPCLAESMMTGGLNNSGVLSMYSSIPFAEWFPPVYMQYFAYFILKNRNLDRKITIGDITYGGSLMSCVLYPAGCRHLIDGYILYGDGSIYIKN